MPSILDTVGTNTYDSYSTAAAGTDYVSRYIPRNRYASPVTGAIGGGYQRPIMFRYIQIYNGTTSTGSLDLEIATNANGTGGMQSGPDGIPGSDQDPDYANYDSSTALGTGPLQYACMATDAGDAAITYYYGIYKNDASRVYYYTGASANASWNPANVYVNGTISTAYPSRVLGGRIGWFHVPWNPTGFGVSSVSYTAANFAWTATTDDGGMPVYGYRLAFQYYYNGGAQGWWVYGGNTAGSPSGTTGTSIYISGFPANCYMEVVVAGLNGVSDNHSGGRAYAAVAGGAFGGNYTSTAAHTGSNAYLTFRTLLAPPTTSGAYAGSAFVNQYYSSSIGFGQDPGYYGGQDYWTLFYTVSSGIIPPGLSLSGSTLSGTPTTPGTYSFSIRARNQDNNYVDSYQVITVSALGPKVNNAGNTARGVAKVHNGSTFAPATMKVHNGTTWTYLT